MELNNRDVDLDELQPHPKNYNRHPPEQVRRLAKSLTKFGQVRSVVVWRKTLLAGHGVAEAARILNWRTVRADVLPDDYPEHLALAYIAADNELAKQGDPDMAQLAAILEESKAADAELLEAIGYSDKEFEALLREVGKGAAAVEDAGAQVDRADELRQKWGTAVGQLWSLDSGRGFEHRLICGDCTDPATVARVMGGERAAAVFTDPPYGINYDPQFLAEIAERHNKRLSSNRTIASDDGSLDLSFLWQYERRMVWGFPYIYDPDATGWIVWDKQPGVESRGIVTPIEMASTTMRKGFDMVRCMWGGFYRAAGEDRQPHPTQKPLGVYRPFVEAWTGVGDVVFDPFTGSAPVLMVCEVLGRKCRAIEIDAGFVAVALDRWSIFTGKTPVLVGAA